MLCEHANPYLIEYAEGELPGGRHTEIEAHLSGCAKCQADLDAIIQFRTMASNWHDEVVPAWKPAPIPGRDYIWEKKFNFHLTIGHSKALGQEIIKLHLFFSRSYISFIIRLQSLESPV